MCSKFLMVVATIAMASDIVSSSVMREKRFQPFKLPSFINDNLVPPPDLGTILQIQGDIANIPLIKDFVPPVITASMKKVSDIATGLANPDVAVGTKLKGVKNEMDDMQWRAENAMYDAADTTGLTDAAYAVHDAADAAGLKGVEDALYNAGLGNVQDSVVDAGINAAMMQSALEDTVFDTLDEVDGSVTSVANNVPGVDSVKESAFAPLEAIKEFIDSFLSSLNLGSSSSHSGGDDSNEDTSDADSYDDADIFSDYGKSSYAAMSPRF